MGRSLKKFLEGFGSVLVISPEPQARRYRFTESDAERLHGDYLRVARDMQKVWYGEIGHGPEKARKRL